MLSSDSDSRTPPAYSKFLPPTLLLGLALLLPAGPLQAASNDAAWWSLNAENNNFVVDQDQHYVNGLNLAYLSPSLAVGDHGFVARSSMAVEDALWPLFPLEQKERDRRFEWTILGQQLFTPANKNLSTPDPNDRPYAGWLYTGFNLLQDTDRKQLDSLSATIGLVGPDALGEQVQNGFHKVFGFGSAEGWSHQLRDEPALTLAYLRKWRFAVKGTGTDGLNADVVPELGLTAGNVLTYGEATALLRAGWGLDGSFGPRLIQPGPTGGGYFNPNYIHRDWSVYLFGGFQQRAVAHNIFLDGNSYQSSPSVDRYIWVHDEVMGVSALGWRRVRIDFTYVRRSEEFRGQRGDDRYGSIDVSTRW